MKTSSLSIFSLQGFVSLRFLGRVLVGFAALVTLLAIFYAEENWRGKRAWESCRSELIARGVELNWHQLAPPRVPDDQNFAMTPFLAPLLDFNSRPLQPGQSPWRDSNGAERARNFAMAFGVTDDLRQGQPSQPLGRMTDLEASLRLLQKQSNSISSYPTRAEAASALLAALEEYQPVIEELRNASRRPYSRFNIDYDAEDPVSILLPHLAVLRRTSQLLRVRASAELALARTDAAFDDVKLMFFLADSIRQEATVVSHMVRIAILAVTQQIVWEGLAEHRWSDAQLRDFQARLQKLTPLKDLGLPLHTERGAFGNAVFELLRKHPQLLREWLAHDSAWPANGLRWLPSGWFYEEQVSYHRMFDQKLLPGYDEQAGQVHPRIIDANAGSLDSDLSNPLSGLLQHRVLVKFVLSGLARTFQKSALSQTGVDQAALACALERYRLANGQLPPTLDSLVPQFIDHLPKDVCNGQPLKYHAADNGQFVLYSVGWNEKDDGGNEVMNKERTAVDPAQGDWVWPAYR